MISSIAPLRWIGAVAPALRLLQSAQAAVIQRPERAGEKARREQRWGVAAKRFGEAALIHPNPQALTAYADTLLRERERTRLAAGPLAASRGADWREASSLMRAALEANDSLHALRPAEREALAAPAR